MEKEFVKDKFANKVRTREWTEKDILKKILFEMRRIAGLLEKNEERSTEQYKKDWTPKCDWRNE
jgi:hypothetical protein